MIFHSVSLPKGNPIQKIAIVRITHAKNRYAWALEARSAHPPHRLGQRMAIDDRMTVWGETWLIHVTVKFIYIIYIYN